MNNQHGISSLVLLLLVALGVFILWELNEYVGNYTSTGPSTSSTESENKPTVCLSGEQGNCNDSNDVFLFTE